MFPFRRKKYRQLSDELLIEELRNGHSELVISILYERYAHLIMGTCMKYLKNVQDSEDVVMEIFLMLESKLLRHEVKHFKSWMYMMTKNECLMKLRKLKKELSSELQEELTQEYEQNNSEKEIQLILMEEKLEELKEEQKQCLILFYLKELSYEQVAQQLRIDIKQVKSAIQNGKRNLKLKLEDDHEFRSTY